MKNKVLSLLLSDILFHLIVSFGPAFGNRPQLVERALVLLKLLIERVNDLNVILDVVLQAEPAALDFLLLLLELVHVDFVGGVDLLD